MKKLLNAVTIIFCIFLTACTHSDNTAANPAILGTNKENQEDEEDENEASSDSSEEVVSVESDDYSIPKSMPNVER